MFPFGDYGVPLIKCEIKKKLELQIVMLAILVGYRTPSSFNYLSYINIIIQINPLFLNLHYTFYKTFNFIKYRNATKYIK